MRMGGKACGQRDAASRTRRSMNRNHGCESAKRAAWVEREPHRTGRTPSPPPPPPAPAPEPLQPVQLLPQHPPRGQQQQRRPHPRQPPGRFRQQRACRQCSCPCRVWRTVWASTARPRCWRPSGCSRCYCLQVRRQQTSDDPHAVSYCGGSLQQSRPGTARTSKRIKQAASLLRYGSHTPVPTPRAKGGAHSRSPDRRHAGSAQRTRRQARWRCHRTPSVRPVGHTRRGEA